MSDSPLRRFDAHRSRELETTRALIDRARGGDQRAWWRLDRRYRDDLLRIVRRNRPSRHQARIGTEDIVQSAFLSAFRGLKGFEPRGRGSFLSWLKVILRHRIAERLRRHGAARRDVAQEDPLNDAPGDHPDPSDLAERSETLAGLLQAITKLPSPEREIVIGHFFHGHSTRQMATRFGMSETAMRRRIGRSLRLLRETLERAPFPPASG